MEQAFGQEGSAEQFDAFMRHYLTLKSRSGEIPRIDEVYEAFKVHALQADVAAAGVEALVQDLRRHAHAYCAMALGKETRPALSDAFHDLRDLKVDVAYPFLLELHEDCRQGLLSEADFLSAVRLVEAYVFRRAVCAIPTNSQNKTFATFGRALKKDRYLESIQAHLQLLPSYRRFPDDEEFKREICLRDLYHFGARRTYWLRRLENHGRKERVAVDEYTIEHLLPQNPNLSALWQADLGPEWQRVQQTWLHTLGNLTLTAYNSTYSDMPFAHKRDLADKGLACSPLKLNQGLGQVALWNEAAIQARAEKLSAQAVQVWAAPKLNDQVLTTYRPKPAAGPAVYTIDDHPHLLSPTVRPLFEAFRQEVLALDACVTEEFLKLYVAYKAETNFVDAVPQARRLRLSLNLPFAEIDDPKGLCKNVAGVGRWGNGEVEVGLSSLDELPYVMGLVRQSLERQLAGGGVV
jgi:predicted transport protein